MRKIYDFLLKCLFPKVSKMFSIISNHICSYVHRHYIECKESLTQMWIYFIRDIDLNFS